MSDAENNNGSSPLRRSRRGAGKVRLEDVAALAGVSTATVSRTFNDPGKVTESIRQRVESAAAQLKWIPNAAGRALASSRTQILGAIIPTLDNEIFASQVSGMQSVLAPLGYSLFLGSSRYDPEEGVRHARAMVARGIEALVIVGEDQPPELFRLLEDAAVPHVVTYGYRAASPHACIGFDNQAAFHAITRHLLELGHRKIAAIFQPTEHNDRAVARIAGVRAALAEAGLSLAAEDLCIGPATLPFAETSFLNFMSRPGATRPTAVICGNDTLALGALLMAQRRGISIPKDCSLTGFDDLAISSRVSPALTTMSVDNFGIGTLAARALLAALDGQEGAPHPREVPARLWLRESTAPPG